MNEFHHKKDGEYLNNYKGNSCKIEEDLIWYNQFFGWFYKKLETSKEGKNELEVKLK